MPHLRSMYGVRHILGTKFEVCSEKKNDTTLKALRDLGYSTLFLVDDAVGHAYIPHSPTTYISGLRNF